ncbi:MAG TPA: glucosaminidase domain-containing protein [Flavobacterium sp.]|jgi:flagellum-specific peptidoglycan hydrolase FlgJ
MIKKIFLLITAILLVSCGSGKSTASKSSKPYRKPSTSVAAKKSTYKKPVAKKAVAKQTPVRPVVRKPSSTANSGSASETEVLQATTRVKVTTEIVLGYISQYKEIAKNNMRQYGIPSSIILAQGILESGAGTGSLSTLANNHFGIKCHTGWTGDSVRHDDDSEQECFRKYSKPSESYDDHAVFLTGRSRYASLFKLDKGDYAAWARGLRAAGYATDPKYPEKLIGLIERYKLDRYDAEVLGKDYVPSANNSIAAVASADTYEVNPGDTLYSISKKFNVSVDELKRKNNMQDNTLSIGQFLKIR